MSLAYRPLTEIFDRVLLSSYIEDVAGLSCSIHGPEGGTLIKFGDVKSLPKLTQDQQAESKAGPVPFEAGGAWAAGLFAKNEYLGYAVVAKSSKAKVAEGAVDFVFQLLNNFIAIHTERDEAQFTADYLRNLMGLMRRLSVRTAAVFDKREVARIFMEECEKLFGVASGAILVLPKAEEKEIPEHASPSSPPSPVNPVSLLSLASFGERLPGESAKRCQEVLASGRMAILDAQEELIVPLTTGMRALGALCLRERQTGPYSEEDLHAAQTLAAMLGAMISGIQFYENLVATELVRMNLARYLSPNLLKEVVEPGKFWSLGGKRMRAAVLFTDIRGFTKMSESLQPEEMVAQLNEYFEEMSEVIFKYDGTLDKFVGDMIMVLFGVPKEMPDASLRAVKTALEMQERLKALNARWVQQGKQPFGVGMGINAGEVIFGNIGSQRAMGLTVIGDHVNQAQRLEAHAKAGEILISDAVREEIKRDAETQELGVIDVRGKTMRAHRVLSILTAK